MRFLTTLLVAVPLLAQTPGKPAGPPKPDVDKFDTYEAYLDALVDWKMLTASKVKVEGLHPAAIEIAALKSEIESLKKELAVVVSVNQVQATAIGNLQHSVAELDPASPREYERVETAAGPLLVSLGKVEPYLDGYRASLEVGNPLAVTFKGISLTVTWGPRRKTGEAFGPWYNKTKHKDFTFTDPLVSGKWNELDLILPETKPDGLGYLAVSATINTISLTH